MTTLEKLIDTLRGIDGPVTLDETHVRQLVAWFDTARNTVAIAEHRRARIDELSQANMRLEQALRDGPSMSPADSAEYLRRLDGDEIRKAVEAAVVRERSECHAAVCGVPLANDYESSDAVVECAQAIARRGELRPVGALEKDTINVAVEAEREGCALVAAEEVCQHSPGVDCAQARTAEVIARRIRARGGK